MIFGHSASLILPGQWRVSKRSLKESWACRLLARLPVTNVHRASPLPTGQQVPGVGAPPNPRTSRSRGTRFVGVPTLYARVAPVG